MSSEFLFPRLTSPFGPLGSPRIPVTVKTRTGELTYRFLIDTGADVSVAPRGLAELVGLDWHGLPEMTVLGIEQAGVTGRLGQLPVRLAGVDFALRCIFLDVPLALGPLLLGRADFLDRFVLTLDAARGRITLTAVQ